MTRQEIQQQADALDLSDKATRRKLNGTVADDVVNQRYKRQWWEVAGCAPLNVSGNEFLRPVANVAFDGLGWVLRFKNEWFCN
jgi:hypothetical protein